MSWRVWLVALVVAGACAQDVSQGRRLFEAQCALCHGQDGRGGRGPTLALPRLKRAADDEALRKVIENGIDGSEMPGAWQLSPREVRHVAAFVRSLGTVAREALPGDPARGAAVYARRGCASCHIVAGQGGGFGPELTEIGARRSAAYLREAIVKPAAAVPDGFAWVEAVKPDGTTLRGIRLNEDSFTIQIKDVSERFHSLRKSDLRELRKRLDESPMPASPPPPGELDDLVAYLASLRGTS